MATSALAREPRIPEFLDGPDGLAVRRPDHADRASAHRRARAARARGPDGLPDRGGARAEPALLLARGRLDRPPRPAAPGDDRGRPRASRLIATVPLAY